ncbi:MAG: hypothetical protein GC181_13085 [Bacteroidetes bacterium]|nr:hypothetical protein [Bacteroidota bacterium]
MKKLFIPLMLCPLLLWNCSSLDERTRFNLTYINRVAFDSTSTSVAKGTLVSDTLVLDYEKDLIDHDTKSSKIEHVRMVLFSVELDKIKSSDKVTNLNFIKGIEVYQLGDNTDDILVAKTDSIPPKIGYFELGVRFDGDRNFEALLNNEISNYRVVYTVREQIKENATVKLGATYEVDSRKFGI